MNIETLRALVRSGCSLSTPRPVTCILVLATPHLASHAFTESARNCEIRMFIASVP